MSVDLRNMSADELSSLVSQAQTEMASREKGKRQELRRELERRVTAEGYKLGDIFPELGGGTTGKKRSMPAKFRNPQNPSDTWSGVGRSPKWVQQILTERQIDVKAFKKLPMYQIHG